MKVFPKLGFNELISKFSADRVVRSGRDVLTNRIGGVASFKIMNTFTAIASHLTQSQAINNENKSDSDEVTAEVTTNDNPSLVTSISSDGKLASPVSKAMSYIEASEDEVLEKEINNGNTIKLGPQSFKNNI